MEERDGGSRRTERPTEDARRGIIGLNNVDFSQSGLSPYVSGR